MSKLILIVAVVAILNYNGVHCSTPVRECKNGKPLPLMVQIDDCQRLPCDIWKGVQSKMAVQFVATKNSMSEINADVRLTTLGAQIPFELEEARSNVCKNLMYGAYCPLDAGEDVTYNLHMQVNDYQPEVPVKIEVNIFDRTDKSVVACFVADGRIKKSMGPNKTF